MKGRVALVTGGSGGIGEACVRRLVDREASVAFTYLSREEAAQRIAEETGARSYRLDLAAREEGTEVVRRIERDLGEISILVHNAGLIRDAPIAFLTEVDWDLVQEVNLRAPFRLTKAVLRGMVRQRWGRVIAIASASGVIGQVGQAHYGAAKAGLMTFMKALAREMARYGVTANSVAPGFIATEMISGLPKAKLDEYLKAVPLGRTGTAAEVAAVVSFLASDEAAYLTGQTIRVDGGLVMS